MAIGIYKKGQGYYTRLCTAIAYALLVGMGAWWLSISVEHDRLRVSCRVRERWFRPGHDHHGLRSPRILASSAGVPERSTSLFLPKVR